MESPITFLLFIIGAVFYLNLMSNMTCDPWIQIVDTPLECLQVKDNFNY